MREIKFCGKRIDNGEWVYGFLLGVDCNSVIAQNQFEWVDNLGLRGGDWFHVIPATVGRYTGLKDKNKREIYEGDIAKWNRVICEIIYNSQEGAFQGRYKCGGGYRFITLMNSEQGFEVIGNIHDNPDLLEVNK